MQQIRTFLRAESVKAAAVDEYNNSVNFKASLTRGLQAEIILTLFKSDSADDKFSAADFSSIVSWIWYADVDYDMTTTPKLIVDEGITVDTDGNIHIPILETNTAEVIAYLGKAETKDLKCELVGLSAGDTKPTFVLQWEFSIRNRIGDEGGGSPVPVDDQHYTVAQVNALFAASDTVEYSADGGSSWSSSYTSGASLIRYRNSMISGAEWTSQSLLPGPMPTISAGSTTTLPAGSSATLNITSSGSAYTMNFGIPAGSSGVTPVLSGGSVTTLPAGSAASAELVGSGSVYTLNLAIPQGPNGSLTVPIQPYSSDSAYEALTCIAYNGGGYQVLSATSAGENPGNTPAKFICFASRGEDGEDGRDGYNGSDGEDGITPVLSGGSVTTLPAGSSATAEIVPSGGSMYVMNLGIPAGQPGPTLIGASQIVSSLTSGNIEVYHAAVPVALKTSTDKFYYLEKGTTSIRSGAWIIDPTAYLAYAGESAFVGHWTVYFAGGIPDNMPILSGGSAIVPQEHRAFQVVLSSGTVIGLNSSSLTTSICVTQELWLDMPYPAVPFSLPDMVWLDGTPPDFDSPETRFAITVRWDGAKLLSNLAYSYVFGSTGIILNSAGEIVSSAMTVSGISIGTDEILYIYNNGTADTVTVGSGGSMTVSRGGTASGTIVSGGGVMDVVSGGYASAATIQGRANIRPDGIIESATVNHGVLMLNGGRAINTVIDNNRMNVSNGGIANSTTINSGGDAYVILYGHVSNTTINSGGSMVIGPLGDAKYTTVNFGGIVSGSDGASLTSNTVAGKMNVIGKVSDNVILSGGSLSFYGSAVRTGVSSGGIFNVLGVADSTTIYEGGIMSVYSSANIASVSSGGSLVVYSSGTAVSVTVNSGGSLVISSGAAATHVVSSAGAVIVVDGYVEYDV